MTFGMSDPVPGVQRYYSDISMIGRHFVVSNSLFPDKLRQYTICNCMEKSVYQEYLRLIETFKIVMRISSSQSPYRSPGLKKSGKGALLNMGNTVTGKELNKNMDKIKFHKEFLD